MSASPDRATALIEAVLGAVYFAQPITRGALTSYLRDRYRANEVLATVKVLVDGGKLRVSDGALVTTGNWDPHA